MNPLAALPLMLSQFVSFEVGVPNRLAITPNIDGKIGVEEWDHLADFTGVRSYFQWEPGVAYVAADVPRSYGARVLIDPEFGSKKRRSGPIELMVVPGENGPRVQVRRLELSQLSWVADAELGRQIEVQTDIGTERWTIEAKVSALDPAYFRTGQRVGVRVEPIGYGSVGSTHLELAPVRLTMDRSIAMPPGFTWQPQIPLRQVVAGEAIDFRFNFVKGGDWKPIRAEMRTVGRAAAQMPELNLPFPNFDTKNRAFVDYPGSVHLDADQGYSIVLCKLTSEKGETAFFQSSFAVKPIVEIRSGGTRILKSADGRKRILVDLEINSNTRRGLKGKAYVDEPSGWSILRGKENPVLIYHARGTAKFRVDLTGSGSNGFLPLNVRAEIGEKVFNRTIFIRLDE